jgi:hypothetical protein
LTPRAGGYLKIEGKMAQVNKYGASIVPTLCINAISCCLKPYMFLVPLLRKGMHDWTLRGGKKFREIRGAEFPKQLITFLGFYSLLNISCTQQAPGASYAPSFHDLRLYQGAWDAPYACCQKKSDFFKKSDF